MIDPEGNTHPEMAGCGQVGCKPVDPNDVDDREDEAPQTPYDAPPKHYAGKGGLDPWAVWDAFDLDRYTANAVKYLLRAGKKDIAPRLDDLKKARNYINKLIEVEEGRSG
ncbi:DUF3310 domain-containing protein [Streptomyces sp. NPDC002754]